MESINTRLKDLRFPHDGEHISITELSEILDIPTSTIKDYETEGFYVPHTAIIKYAQHFNVSTDFLLGLSDIRNVSNIELRELHLSEPAMEKLRNQTINPWLLSDIIEHDEFDGLMIDASIYVDGFVDQNVQQMNSFIDFQRDKLIEVTNDKNNKDLELIKKLHISQDAFFAHTLYERFRQIIFDIREKHKGDAATADIAPVEQTELLNELADAIKNSSGNNAAKTLAGAKVIFSKLLRNKKKTTNKSNSMSNENIENILNQSPVIEPDSRKRRNSIRKSKSKKD